MRLASAAAALVWCLAASAGPACTALAITERNARARRRARPLVGRALSIRGGSALTSTLERAELSWRERVAATESANHLKFKLVLEAGYGATLQLAAELQRRGVSGAWLEVDYVMAGILTAVAGKTYAAYRVAPTKFVEGSDEPAGSTTTSGKKGRGVPRWIATAPTNAFQLGKYTLAQRLGAFVAPAPRLFTSGCACGLAGYSFAAGLSQLRALAGAGPSLAPAVPILPATLYTGMFLVIVSNLTLQFLQGVIEARLIEPATRKHPAVGQALIAVFRAARSLFASAIAIRGMQLLKLQAKVAATAAGVR